MAKKIKIVALLPLLAFGLPQSEGQVAEVEKMQADEIIGAGYGELYVAPKKVDVVADAGVESDEPDADQDKATE
jgi:F0F1-type ATP synthase epsilon subunit